MTKIDTSNEPDKNYGWGVQPSQYYSDVFRKRNGATKGAPAKTVVDPIDTSIHFESSIFGTRPKQPTQTVKPVRKMTAREYQAMHCSCHINPPCGHCTDSNEWACPECIGDGCLTCDDTGLAPDYRDTVRWDFS